MTKKKSLLRRLPVALGAIVVASLAVNQVGADDFFYFSKGPFSIRFADRRASSLEPEVVSVAPPKFHHPTASLFAELDELGARGKLDAPTPLVAPTPQSVVYDQAYRAAPYLTAKPEPVRARALPSRRNLVIPREPSARLEPFPTRPNHFRPNPYFGPGPHIPGPNHFGGMTPLGPGPDPSYGPR